MLLFWHLNSTYISLRLLSSQRSRIFPHHFIIGWPIFFLLTGARDVMKNLHYIPCPSWGGPISSTARWPRGVTKILRMRSKSTVNESRCKVWVSNRLDWIGKSSQCTMSPKRKWTGRIVITHWWSMISFMLGSNSGSQQSFMRAKDFEMVFTAILSYVSS